MMEINQDFFDFIKRNKEKDSNKLRLSLKQKDYNFDLCFAITQIECRKKNSLKIRDFLVNNGFLFPDIISGEQSSHQAIASYHSSLINNSGKVLDMTAGLGIDAMSFAKKGCMVTAVELNPLKVKVLQHNANELNLKSLNVINADSLEFLEKTNLHYDLIFVDPSRRGNDNKRLYDLKDCSPNILENQELLFFHTDKILIKASPLLDITQTMKDFQNISSIKALGVKGECKELLIELTPKQEFQNIILEAVNLNNDGNIISSFSEECGKDKDKEIISYATQTDLHEKAFILEPSAMVMKLALWESICKRFNAKKFSKSSHLFVTNSLPDDFPGRVTKFKDIIKKQDRKSMMGLPASVVSRNHPLSPDEIRKSLKLKEGDKNFIYATRLGDKPLMFLSESISGR